MTKEAPVTKDAAVVEAALWWSRRLCTDDDNDERETDRQTDRGEREISRRLKSLSLPAPKTEDHHPHHPCPS